MNDDKSMLPSIGSEAEQAPLRLLEDIYTIVLYKRKQRLQRTHKRLDTDRVWTEIETLQWV